MTRNKAKTGAEALDDLARIASTALSECLPGVPPDTAEHFGSEVMQRMAAHWGGSSLYMPKADAARRHARDAQIIAAFDGTNTGELSRRFGVSQVWIYAILRRARGEKAK